MIRRHERYARELREDDTRRGKRDGEIHRATILRPNYWDLDPAFDPYHVRKNADSIAAAVRRALRAGSFRPFNPVLYEVPKSDGTPRPISVFPIVETTIASRVFRTLVTKNAAIMSANSFAYRLDRTPHDAVQAMSNDFVSAGRVFVAEYDFSRFFDSLNHEALWDLSRRHKVLWTRFERELIASFLQTRAQSGLSYNRWSDGVNKSAGLPQGNSLSLFMANIAALDMDRAIERCGVGYVRYADDTVMWSDSYSRLIDAAEALRMNGAAVGAQINAAKSSGIRIFNSVPEKSEFKATTSIDFIGYTFHRDRTSIRDSTLERIKKRVAALIWENLLSDTEPFTLSPNRIAPPVDRDYVTLIFQLRRYVYGGMSEARLAKLLRGKSLRINFPGVMSYFPLVSDTQQLRDLDGWMLHTIQTSLELRRRRILAQHLVLPGQPYGLDKSALLRLQTPSSGGHPLDLRVPSFTRIGTVVNRASQTHGANAIARTAKGAQYLYGMGT